MPHHCTNIDMTIMRRADGLKHPLGLNAILEISVLRFDSSLF